MPSHLFLGRGSSTPHTGLAANTALTLPLPSMQTRIIYGLWLVPAFPSLNSPSFLTPPSSHQPHA